MYNIATRVVDKRWDDANVFFCTIPVINKIELFFNQLVFNIMVYKMQSQGMALPVFVWSSFERRANRFLKAALLTIILSEINTEILKCYKKSVINVVQSKRHRPDLPFSTTDSGFGPVASSYLYWVICPQGIDNLIEHLFNYISNFSRWIYMIMNKFYFGTNFVWARKNYFTITASYVLV